MARDEVLVAGELAAMGIGSGSVVLDAPVGTGRFFPLYKALDCDVVGIDISTDMLAIAEERARQLRMGRVTLTRGDLTETGIGEATADVAVCMRFAHLVDVRSLGAAVTELGRVSCGNVLVTVSLWNPVTGAGSGDALLQSAGRVKQRIKRLHTRGRTRTHGESAIEGEFRSRGFEIVAREKVNEGRSKAYWMFRLCQGPWDPRSARH